MKIINRYMNEAGKISPIHKNLSEKIIAKLKEIKSDIEVVEFNILLNEEANGAVKFGKYVRTFKYLNGALWFLGKEYSL